jgi:hypothetical protein
MINLRYTLLSDGSSDRALMPMLNWLLRLHLPNCPIQGEWADLRHVNKSLRDSFEKRIQLSVDLYPCDLFFIHRNAEKEPRENRVVEIQKALQKINVSTSPTVYVIPVRMTEAWLLFNLAAIRQAASNPNGKVNLQLPSLKQLENNPDPKQVLHDLLYQATELPNRRLRNFPVSERVIRVAELIDDFSPLLALPAFAALETELKEVIKSQTWESAF